eukprot:scaffold9616_cov112-Isochrysis_galbana.AAC.1
MPGTSLARGIWGRGIWGIPQQQPPTGAARAATTTRWREAPALCQILTIRSMRMRCNLFVWRPPPIHRA